MDNHTHSRSGESSTSAIDLTGTPAGIGSSVPPSPALVPRESLPRRRLSWGRMDTTHDPLRFDSADPPRINTRPANYSGSGWAANDDPFYSPTVEDSPSFPHTFSYQSGGRGTYSTAQPGPSSASLISRGTDGTGTPDDDDEAALTGGMSRPGWRQNSDVDPESSAATKRSRKTVRYSTSPSPLRKTGNRLATFSRNIRRASIRVVNMAGIGVDEHVRLEDAEDEKEQRKEDEEPEEVKEHDEDPVLDLSRALPIRGRTLGCMGPTNKLRLAMYKFLVYPWTEPLILLLIIINAVVLTIQAAPGLAFNPDAGEERLRLQGYFHEWEDYALFALFCIFTLESFARIAVTGFLLDPEIPVSAIFTSIFSSNPDFTLRTSSSDPVSISRHPSLVHSHSQTQMLSRNPTVTERLRRFRSNLSRPFTLAHHSMSVPSSQPNTSTPSRPSSARARSDTVQSKTPMIEKAERLHSHVRNPSQPTFMSKALKSDNGDVLSLPFRLSVERSHQNTHRNLPYLRHSWTRIDFVTFALATTGVERGTRAICAGVYRERVRT